MSRWWLSDRPEYRLSAHFFRAMFDFGILTQVGADSLTRMLLGGLGGLLGAGFVLTRGFVGRYQALAGGMSAEPYRRTLLGDDLFIIAVPMLAAALVTLLVSDLLFPDDRDFRILGPLPVRRAVVFGAKLAALVLFNGILIAAVHLALAPIVLVTSAHRWREQPVWSRMMAWAVASISASALAVLAIMALVGVLVLTLSRDRLNSLTALLRSVLLAALLSCVPLAVHLSGFGGALADRSAWLAFVPPAWFVALERVLLGSADSWLVRLAGVALAATASAALVVTVAYALLFLHFERLMLRSTAMSSIWRTGDLMGATASGATPAFRAVYRFTTTTLGRSGLHQTVLVGLSGCGLGIAINGLLGADMTGWLRTGGAASLTLAAAASWAPFAVMLTCGLSARLSLSLPIEHRANWIFRLAEDQDTRTDQLRAVDRLVTTTVVGPAVASAIAIFWIPFGAAAGIGTAVVALVGLLYTHVVLLGWSRIPFTSSYVPGKRFVVHTFVLACLAWLTFTVGGSWLARTAMSAPGPAVAILGGLSLVTYLLKRRRAADWKRAPLVFEDDFPDQPLELGL
jgi:hypothetical protein